MSYLNDAVDALRSSLLAELSPAGELPMLTPGESPRPPCLIIGYATLVFDAHSHRASGVQIPVWLVELADASAWDRLMDRLPAVVEAVEGVGEIDATVTGASPAFYAATTTAQLPCYDITVEIGIV